MDYQQIIDKYYPVGTSLRDIYMRHCRSVADLALAINERLVAPLDPGMVEAAAMLHDVGIYRCYAPSIQCHGTLPYIAHGVEGAEMLRAEGPQWEFAAGVAEHHTGSGITAAEVKEQQLPLAPGDYLPQNRLERLVCYADKFFSKSGDMQMKSIDKVRDQMSRHGSEALARFDALVEEFGSTS